MKRPHRKWLLLFVLIAVILNGAPPARAQVDMSSSASGSATWREEFTACFDKQNRPILLRLRQFVQSVEAERARTRANRDPDNSRYLLSLLAAAYTQLGDWKEAEQACLELVPQPSYFEQSQWTYQQLAGIYAMQGKWSRAAAYYGRWAGSQYLFVVGPILLVCLGWLLLWQIGARRALYPRLSGLESKRLLLLACLPLFIALFNDMAEPLNSYLLAGNAGAWLVTLRTAYLVTLTTNLQWIVLILTLSRVMRKRGWLAGKADPSEESEHAPAESAQMAPRPAKRIRLYLTVALIGFAMEHLIQTPYFFHTLSSLPHSLATAWKEQSRDFLWLMGLLSTAVISPIAQEVFFRARIFAYSRQTAGMAFGLVFSSLVFAGVHLRGDEFARLFLVGILYAVQFEVTGHLAPSTLSHMAHNFLASISRLR